MSELIAPRQTRDFRLGLLTQASILALMGTACVAASSHAASDDKPTVWIELGGQLERVDTKQPIFSPSFFDDANPSVLNAMVDSQRPSRYDSGLEGGITFAPQGTSWSFSAAVRYGHVKNARHLHYETAGLPSFEKLKNGQPQLVIVPKLRALGDGQSNSSESHLIVDFQVGKDVGLGLFKDPSTSKLELGVRFAQFISRSSGNLHALPVYSFGAPVRYKQATNKYYTRPLANRQTNYANFHATRSTHAIGPSVAWKGSVPILHGDSDMAVLFDLGINGAVLFGRQKVHESHETTGKAYHFTVNANAKVKISSAYVTSGSNGRIHSVVIPNVGGFAGVSLKFPNAKISLGYRGDFFFKATDIGFDAREAQNRNFFGPFATISIGLGG